MGEEPADSDVGKGVGMTTMIKNLLERTQQQPLLAQARDLVLALN